jgi:hypothetical protein
MFLQGHQVVVDLAAATLSMLSQRPPAHEVIASAGSIPALLQLLDPLQSACAVENAAKALGNLSADAACRSLIRSSGGVGSLSRLLREDCASSMQVRATAILAASCPQLVCVSVCCSSGRICLAGACSLGRCHDLQPSDHLHLLMSLLYVL